MPLSTSSSRQRIPQGPWVKIWALALILTLAILSGWEGMWRTKGFVPAINDSPALWSKQRRKAGKGSGDQVVIIGASRIHVGMDLEVLANKFNGRKVIQLAMVDSLFLPVLHNLAEDESFNGVLICSVGPWVYVNRPSKSDTSSEYIEYYKSHTNINFEELFLPLDPSRYFVLLNPQLSIENLMAKALIGNMPTPRVKIMKEDRSVKADFKIADVTQLRKKFITVALKRYYNIDENHDKMDSMLDDLISKQDDVRGNIGKLIIKLGKNPDKPENRPVSLKDILMDIEKSIITIQKRGGQVVIFRMPSSGALRELEEIAFPRDQFWNEWTARTEAVAIHYQDYPSLAKFDCPEYSHLDFRDTPEFSGNMAKIINGKLK